MSHAIESTPARAGAIPLRRLPNLLAFGLLVWVLILSGYALSTVVPVVMFAVPLCVVLTLHLVGGRSVAWADERLAAWFFLVVAVLLSAVLDRGEAPLPNAVVFLSFWTAGYLLSQAISRATFLTWFLRSMDFFAVVGTSASILVLATGLDSALAMVENRNGVVYRNGYVFFLIVSEGGVLLQRVMGPFWEPGLFASFLVIACLTELCLVERRPNRWRVAAYVVSILLTQSTAAYILFLPLAFVAYFRHRRRGVALPMFLSVVALGLLMLFIEPVIRFLVDSTPSVFGKMDNDGLLSETRLNALFVNLTLFAQSPFLGLGIGMAGEAFSQSMGSDIRAQTSTSGFLMAALGLGGVGYTVMWVRAVAKTRVIAPYARLWFLVCILIILNKEPHMSILFTHALLFQLLRAEVRDDSPAVRVRGWE